ncbi:MAG TPA: DUF2125 domain-containing protein [Rhizomicrobium sp.]|jgi:hypothetical protein
MKYSSRFFLWAPLALLLTLAALAMIHWWIDASALSKRLDAVNGHEIMPGVRVSFAQKRIAGFPFRLDTILKDLRVEVREVDGSLIWMTQDFAMHALTYGRVQAILEAAGPQTLTWHDAHGGAHRFEFLPGSFRASAILQDGRLVRFDSEIVDLDGADFRAADAQFHFRIRGDAIDTFVKLQRAYIPGGYAAALGPNIDELTAKGTLDSASTLDRLLRGLESPSDALDGWRRRGALDVTDFSLKRKQQRLSLRGRLTLDAHHDLSGTLRGPSGTSLAFQGNRIVPAGSGLGRP